MIMSPLQEPPAMPAFCAIDFGTSNSAIALPSGAGVQPGRTRSGQHTMPTAVFYAVEGLASYQEPQRHYGRAAVAAYVEGVEGRLMRVDEKHPRLDAGDAGHRRRRRPFGALPRRGRQLPAPSEGHRRTPGRATLTKVVLGRPVILSTTIRHGIGGPGCADRGRTRWVSPTSASSSNRSRQHWTTSTVEHEQLVLVADIGGGTSDFSLVRVGPQQRRRPTGKTTFWPITACTSRAPTSTARSNWPYFAGLRLPRPGPTGREVPSKVYFDLATWHLINTVYAPAACRELKA